MKITLRNDFHNTEVNVIINNGYLTPNQVKRANRQLCGISGCSCSGELGTRGHNEYSFESYPDGSARLVTE